MLFQFLLLKSFRPLYRFFGAEATFLIVFIVHDALIAALSYFLGSIMDFVLDFQLFFKLTFVSAFTLIYIYTLPDEIEALDEYVARLNGE